MGDNPFLVFTTPLSTGVAGSDVHSSSHSIVIENLQRQIANNRDAMQKYENECHKFEEIRRTLLTELNDRDNLHEKNMDLSSENLLLNGLNDTLNSQIQQYQNLELEFDKLIRENRRLKNKAVLDQESKDLFTKLLNSKNKSVSTHEIKLETKIEKEQESMPWILIKERTAVKHNQNCLLKLL